jgi:D-alanyl-lipoteichoic acid acyltransferase DltB (MBOAT superfamily)
LGYWLLQSQKLIWQNLFLILASWVFYAWWDIRFLLLLILSTTIDFYLGQKIEDAQQERTKKIYLWFSLFTNLSALAFFKYFSWLIASAEDLLGLLGFEVNVLVLNIILPVGISLYTLQKISYIVDIYYKRIQASRNSIQFFAFVSFFPPLIAGPISRAKKILPQFENPRVFDPELARDGLKQALWGYFKKIVIADGMAGPVGYVFGNYQQLSGLDLVIGVFLFSVQIYCDFSGYSDIAIGLARLFGFKLDKNFDYPYYAIDIAEFWRKWHISLTAWLRDYIYFPIIRQQVAKSRDRRRRIAWPLVFVFLVSGLWHGANYTFLFWGGLHGVYHLLPWGNLSQKLDLKRKSVKNAILRSFFIGLTFTQVSFAWIFFRADSFMHAAQYIRAIFTNPIFFQINIEDIQKLLILSIVVFLLDWIQRNQDHVLEIKRFPKAVRQAVYYAVLITILLEHNEYVPFIYFKF